VADKPNEQGILASDKKQEAISKCSSDGEVKEIVA
jgi:hypothetical protein